MVLDDRLTKDLANRDVVEPSEWETRVHTGASLRHRPDDMRRSVRVLQRSAIATTHLPYNVAPFSVRLVELMECEASVTMSQPVTSTAVIGNSHVPMWVERPPVSRLTEA